MSLPTDDKARKALPIFRGPLMYFPDALLEVAAVCKAGNDQHNPGEPLHWARGKSMEQLDTALRHMMDHGLGATRDTDGRYHMAKAAWRLLAELQLTIERDRAAPAVDAPSRQLELNLAAPSDGRPTTEIDPEVLRDAARMAEADARLAEIAGAPRPPAPWVPKVGDRVVVRQCALGYLEGQAGEIIEVDDVSPRYLVQFSAEESCTHAWCVSVASAGQS